MSATQQVSPFIVRPQVTPVVEPITQSQLALVLSLRGRLSQLSQQVETAEESIKQRLQQGAGVESGHHTAALHTAFRRNVSWKCVAERLADRFKLDGAAFTARVLRATRPTPIVSLELR